jgi:uncharacterized protein (TIGR02599 family)
MTRRLGQATLNAYWRAFESDMNSEQANLRFRRQSDLQFLSGPTERIFTAGSEIQGLTQPVEEAYPTHAVFFQAPLGFTEYTETENGAELRKFRPLDNLLTGCGYFIEYGPDPDVPEFLVDNDQIPTRHRFRLMEMTVPAERLNIFQRPQDTKGFNDPRIFNESGQFPYISMVNVNRAPDSSWIRPLWMKDALRREPIEGSTGGTKFQFARPRAENIVALIVLPKLAEKDRVNIAEPELAPYYEYDSWRILLQGQQTVQDGNTKVKVDNVARDNLLPPIVQVTMVAVDEGTMVKSDATATNIPKWTEGLFKKVQKESEYFDDMETLEKERLQNDTRVNYRIFTTDVVIRASKWSRDPFTLQTP